jgi:hypothetical protein
MITVDTSELSDDEFESIVQSRGFQKMLLYQRLSDGIEVLEDHDLVLDSMIESITDRHSQLESEEITRECLNLLYEEIRMYTEPLGRETTEKSARQVVGVADIMGGMESNESVVAVREYISSQLTETETLEVKAKEIAKETGIHSTYVGRILGGWRNHEDAPFTVSATEASGGVNRWTIKQ